MTKSIADIISLKRDGQTMSKDDIETWIEKLLVNEITDAQLGAWLMAVYIRGLNAEETADLTRIMTFSGETMEWPKEWKNILEEASKSHLSTLHHLLHKQEIFSLILTKYPVFQFHL